jgi:hypothetical protein
MANVSIRQAKRLFDQWRQGRTGREAAPAKLRGIALALKNQHGERVARDALGLSSDTLWRWGKKAMAVRPPKAGKKPALKAANYSSPSATAEPVDFVEVTPAAREPISRVGVTLLFERGDGTRMRIRGALEASQIERLAGRFLAGALLS